MTRDANITFLGLRDDVEDLYAAMDLYVLASYREGFPRSAMEAAASGLPVVATDIRGCRQVVEPDRTGLLVPAHDAGALTAAIRALGADADRRGWRTARPAVKARRAPSSTTAPWSAPPCEIYDRLLAGRSA